MWILVRNKISPNTTEAHAIDDNGVVVLSPVHTPYRIRAMEHAVRAVNHHEQLRQCIRDLLLCIQVPADAPAYAAACKLLNETEAK